jgi:hypothetical protein
MAGPSTLLRDLGDVIPVPLPVRPEVASPGDVLIVAGLAEFVFIGMRPRRLTGIPALRWRRPAVTLSPPRRRSSDGEEESQAQGPGQEQGEPWEAPELLTGWPRT